MIRSLYSGVSGMTNHQTRMDVIGNNIANVNTYGFKGSTAIFKDVFYQQAIAPTGGTISSAGNNPATVGYGVQLAGIVKDMTPSNFMNTFQTLDLAISGDGFFITAQFPGNATHETNPNPSNVTYTRMGMLTIDSHGNLVDMNNRFILGTRNTMTGLQATGVTSLNELAGAPAPLRASDLTFENTININDLIREAYNIYNDDNGFLYTYRRNPDGSVDRTFPVWADESGNPMADPAARAAVNAIFNGINPAFADLLRNLAAPNPPVDPTGRNASIDPTVVGPMLTTFFDNLSTTLGFTAAGTVGFAAMSFFRAEFENLFNGLTATTVPRIPSINTVAGAVREFSVAARNFALSQDEFLMRAEINNADNARASGAVRGEFSVKDLAGFNIGRDGVITTMFNNQLKAVARIELAVFDNIYGLQEAGNTSFIETMSSGEAFIKRPGTEGAGDVESGKLEMSNVNLAKEFSDMIVTQRGFQANSRMITVSDSMLEELVNLKR